MPLSETRTAASMTQRKFSMKKMALKSTFGFTTVNHYYTEEERQVNPSTSQRVSAIKKTNMFFFKTNQIPFIRLLLELDVFRFFLKKSSFIIVFEIDLRND